MAIVLVLFAKEFQNFDVAYLREWRPSVVVRGLGKFNPFAPKFKKYILPTF